MSFFERWGKWRYRFKLGGRRHEGGTGLAATRQNLTAAKAIEARARLDAEQGLNPKLTRALTFAMAAAEFLDWCNSTRYRDHPNSAKRICGSFASLLEFFDKRPIAEIAPIEIERYKTHRATVHHVKNCTIRNDLNALSLFFQHARRAKWCRTNPLLGEDKIKRPGNEDAIRIHVITPGEEDGYFAAIEANSRFRTVGEVAKLMLLQGARPEEVLALKVGDFDAQSSELHIRGGKTRMSVFPLKSRAALLNI